MASESYRVGPTVVHCSDTDTSGRLLVTMTVVSPTPSDTVWLVGSAKLNMKPG